MEDASRLKVSDEKPAVLLDDFPDPPLWELNMFPGEALWLEAYLEGARLEPNG